MEHTNTTWLALAHTNRLAFARTIDTIAEEIRLKRYGKNEIIKNKETIESPILYELYVNNKVPEIDALAAATSFSTIGIPDEPLKYAEILYYVGYYYQFELADKTGMEKYYLLAIDKGSIDAMYNLSSYYMDNYPNETIIYIRYLSMATEKGHVAAMRRLIKYYCSEYQRTQIYDQPSQHSENMIKYCTIYIQNKYDIMQLGINLSEIRRVMQNLAYAPETIEKFFLDAFENSKSDKKYEITRELAFYHDICDISNEKAIKYYMLCIENKLYDVLPRLKMCFYSSKMNKEEVERYYLQLYQTGIAEVLYELCSYYKLLKDNENTIKYCIKAIEVNDSRALEILEKCEMSDETAEKYLIDLHSEGKNDALFHLAHYFYKKMNYIRAIECYSRMGASSYCLDLFSRNEAYFKSYLDEHQAMKEKIKILEKKVTEQQIYITDLEHRPVGPKYEEAKTEFETLANSL